ncbi:transcription factor IIIB 50 kDa subunit [Pleurodeles waltl]
MSDFSKCPDCGSSDIVDDAHYSQNQLVCAACGFILTEGLLTTTQAEEGFSQGVRFSESTGEKDSISRCKLREIIRVRNLCRTLRLPNTFEDTAISYFERAFNHPSFHQASLPRKEVIVGCCIYITCRQHSWPLTMGTICSVLYADCFLFASTYGSLVKELELDVPAVSLAEMVKSHCKSFRLCRSDSNIPAQHSEDADKIAEMTLKIMEVASDTWLVTGRHPIPIITAAAYLAWQSLRPASRLKHTFPFFCKLAEIDQPPPSTKRLKEIYSVLLRLAYSLPWLKKFAKNAKMVVQWLGDILNHRNFLLEQALGSHIEITRPESCSMNRSESMTDEPHDKLKGTSLPTSKLVNGQGPEVKRPFLPPCVENPRKKLRMPQLSEVRACTGEEDISDSEIQELLRTQEEMDEYSKACSWD